MASNPKVFIFSAIFCSFVDLYHTLFVNVISQSDLAIFSNQDYCWRHLMSTMMRPSHPFWSRTLEARNLNSKFTDNHLSWQTLTNLSHPSHYPITLSKLNSLHLHLRRTVLIHLPRQREDTSPVTTTDVATQTLITGDLQFVQNIYDFDSVLRNATL